MSERNLPTNIAGGLRFSDPRPPSVIQQALEGVLGVTFKSLREDNEGVRHYRAKILGLTLVLGAGPEADAYGYTLAYRSANAYYDAPADTVSIDFHFAKLLAGIGIAAERLHPPDAP